MFCLVKVAYGFSPRAFFWLPLAGVPSLSKRPRYRSRPTVPLYDTVVPISTHAEWQQDEQ